MVMEPADNGAGAGMGLQPVDFIETELSRFLATLGKISSHTFGRYKIEFIVPREFKDAMWPCTDEQGMEVLVTVCQRRAVGIPDPTAPPLHPAIMEALEARVNNGDGVVQQWDDSWNVDDGQ